MSSRANPADPLAADSEVRGDGGTGADRPLGRSTRSSRSPRAAWLALGLFAGLLVLTVASAMRGSTSVFSLETTLRGVLAVFGLGAPLEPAADQIIVELRLWRTLVCVGVGASLALSGALLQGVFRNALASPSVLGVTTGASFGATLGILVLAGYGSLSIVERLAFAAPLFVTACAFVGGLAVTVLVQLPAALVEYADRVHAVTIPVA